MSVLTYSVVVLCLSLLVSARTEPKKANDYVDHVTEFPESLCDVKKDCTIQLPQLADDTTGTQLSPKPSCSGDHCTLKHGESYVVDTGINQICSKTRSSEFSVRGGHLVTKLLNDPYIKRVEGSCVGLETDTFYGMGLWQLGVDYDIDSLKLHCNDGEVTGTMKGRRDLSRKFVNDDSIPTTPAFPVTAKISGIESLECGACSPFNNDDATYRIEKGALTIDDPNEICDRSGDPVVCTIKNVPLRSDSGGLTVILQGACPRDQLRVIGSQLDISAGNSNLGYPKDGWPQMYNYQGTCVTLQMGNETQAGAKGLVLYNIEDDTFIPNNSLGVATVNIKFTMEPDRDPVKDRVVLDMGRVETIECGTCPSNQQFGPSPVKIH